MKVLRATKATQGQRKSDYFFCRDGELVYLAFACDSDTNPDDGCGCLRGFGGFETHKAGTTAVVVEWCGDLSTYWMEMMKCLTDEGWVKTKGRNKTDPEDAAELCWYHVRQVQAVADDLEPGTVVERRGRHAGDVQPRRLGAGVGVLTPPQVQRIGRR
jgi:hypothetical protein